jgi:hypothetical protein
MFVRARSAALALGPPSCFDARAVAMGIHSEAQLDVKFIDFARQLQRARFVRKHSLYKLTQSMKKLRLASVVSILGHARHTASLRHLLRRLRHSPLWPHLPSVYRRAFA